MADPFIGEIKLISWNYAPRGWAFCDGATLAISTNQALFSLLGTTYGGDGVTTFKLPDLRTRIAVSANTSTMPLGGTGGEPTHVLTAAETPSHTHQLSAINAAGSASAVTPGESLAGFQGYVAPAGAPISSLDPSAVTTVGAGAAHENRQPFLCMSYAIALQGIFPSRP